MFGALIAVTREMKEPKNRKNELKKSSRNQREFL